MSAIVSAIQPGIRGIIGSALALPSIDLTPEQVLMAIFAGGAKGAWYERGNAASVYQGGAAVAQGVVGSSVGFGVSRDQGLALGPELITNGGFDVDAGWAKGTGWSISGGLARLDGSNTGATSLGYTTSLDCIAGAYYRMQFDFASTSGRLRLNPFIGNSSANTVSGTSGTSYGTFKALGTSPWSFTIQAVDANSVLTVDKASVRRVFGNPQIQASAGLQPVLQAGPRRLVFDGVDDVMTTTFDAALGANCTVIRAAPGTGVLITTGVTIGTSFADNVTGAALIIIDRPLNVVETAAAISYGNQQLVF